MRSFTTSVPGLRPEIKSRSGQLGESVHAAGTVYGGKKLVVAAPCGRCGVSIFNRPIGTDNQVGLTAKGAHMRA